MKAIIYTAFADQVELHLLVRVVEKRERDQDWLAASWLCKIRGASLL